MRNLLRENTSPRPNLVRRVIYLPTWDYTIALLDPAIAHTMSLMDSTIYGPFLLEGPSKYRIYPIRTGENTVATNGVPTVASRTVNAADDLHPFDMEKDRPWLANNGNV